MVSVFGQNCQVFRNGGWYSFTLRGAEDVRIRTSRIVYFEQDAYTATVDEARTLHKQGQKPFREMLRVRLHGMKNAKPGATFGWSTLAPAHGSHDNAATYDGA